MLDFVEVKANSAAKNVVAVSPEFIARRSKDLMIKGGSFYAIWNEKTGFWSKSEYDAQMIIDNEIMKFSNEYDTSDKKVIKLLRNFSSKKYQEFQLYCRSMPDNYHELDDRIVFSNTEIKKTDYITRRLDYSIEPGDISAYEEIISTLYDDSERNKLEWAIGAIISGDSKTIQKFIVLFGDPGSGKSTFLNILQQLFPGYYTTFDAKSIAQSSNQFSLEPFKNNPLIAIQHDGDLSKIEDNTRLNSIISHEELVVNEKFKSTYTSKFKSFLFMGTNKPVSISDARSGMMRRLIDVTPSGRLLPIDRYDELMEKIKFELGGIADHCLKVYNDCGRTFYNKYSPQRMISATNDLYNFLHDDYIFFAKEHSDGVSLNVAWDRYKKYCDESNINFMMSKTRFRTELLSYFTTFRETGGRAKDWYSGFRRDKFKIIDEETIKEHEEIVNNDSNWIILKEQDSLFDEGFEGSLAQYAKEDETPEKPWDMVKTKLSDLDTHRLHYLLIDGNYICIDFDLKDENGNKSLLRNLEAANKWPKTYVETSKGGQGLHLIYSYSGDVSKLSRIYDNDIEVKVFNGKASLRRKLTKCNDVPITTINSGLPLKGEKNVIDFKEIKSERSLRNQIIRNLRKEIHNDTSSSIDMIYKILEDAYNSGLKYDVSDIIPDIQQFACNSTHQAQKCIRVVNKMHFKSKDQEQTENIIEKLDKPIIFYDVEVFPNLFLICWKLPGDNTTINKMINPSPKEVEDFINSYALIGYNNRKYDNHILYGRIMGYTEKQLFDLSQKIISEGVLKFGFPKAYNISYTDVYDFLSSGNKKSLKKWEIDLGIHHMELGFRWDEEVPEDKWPQVSEYCGYDVIATEAVFNSKEGQVDWKAREILAEISGLSVNNTTNQCTIKLIVGDDPNPQSKFVYTDLSKEFPGYEFNLQGIDKSKYEEGTKIVSGKSLYLGEDPGEGGYVYANPGIYYNVDLMDIASMHPTSAHELDLFGPYTPNYWNLVLARLHIKHKEYKEVKKMFSGKLSKYLTSDEEAKELSNALKTAINSVYGLTSATFDNKLRDPRNIDNIVAKRGALFMINLKHEVENRGYKVVHIKTDSIKIANSNSTILKFVHEYGKKYGYNFEHEANYSKLCLVNESTYVAFHSSKEYCEREYNYIPEKNEKNELMWTATGAQFQVPYVFKKLFSHDEIIFKDLCETKSVTTAMYLDFNELLPEEEHDYRFVGRVGEFCPMIDGIGGGILLRDNGEGKYSAVVGTKKQFKVGKDECPVYRWMESEMVKILGLSDKINRLYYDHLVDEAVSTISQFGDVEMFIEGSPKIIGDWINPPEDSDEPLPFV